ncbi:MAG: hypothetical protein ABIR96_12665 [Bdellovibrionota bacterium]
MKSKRKKFLINPDFQISVIKQMLVLACAVIAIFYSASFYHFWSLKQQGLAMGLPATHVFFQFLRDQQDTMDLFFLFTSIATIVAIVGFGIFLSHRVAGPLFRMKQYLDKDLDAAEPALLKFRDGDYFPEIAESLNVRLSKTAKGSTPKT